MPRSSAKRRASAYTAEQLALKSARVELDDIARIRSDTDQDMTNRVFSLVESYKASCRLLLERRTACITDLASSHPAAANLLEQENRYYMPVLDRALFDKGGNVFIYRPDSDEPDLDVDASSSPSLTPWFSHAEAKSYGSSSGHLKSEMPQGEPAQSPRESEQPQGQSEQSLGETELPLRTKSRSKKTTQRPKQPELFNNQAPKPRALRPRRIDTIIDRAVARSRTRKQVMLIPTIPPAMTMPKVDKTNCWVFEHRLRYGPALFTMRCASLACEHPVFSKHPLKHDRAAKHLRDCGLPFKNENDMIYRYAQFVIPSNGKKVTRSWAKKHNSRLLGANEQDLEEENFQSDDE